jgi:hypothetical protein
VSDLRIFAAGDDGLGQPIGALIDSLHHVFGDNDLLVARRQLRAATGEALTRWTEVVDRLEQRRGWSRDHRSPA